MHSRLNGLAPAGFVLSICSFLITVFASLCVFGLMLNSVVGALAAIVALVCASVGLTMTGIARSEIVRNAQYGDEFAVSGMAVGIVACVMACAAIALYFILFR